MNISLLVFSTQYVTSLKSGMHIIILYVKLRMTILFMTYSFQMVYFEVDFSSLHWKKYMYYIIKIFFIIFLLNSIIVYMFVYC